MLQHRFSGDANIEARHLLARGFDQFPQPFHRRPILVIGRRLRGHQVNAAFGKRDIDLLFGVFPFGKQRVNSG